MKGIKRLWRPRRDAVPSSTVPPSNQPNSPTVPFDIMDMIVSYLDWPSLKSFSLTSHDCNDEANRRLWRSVAISPRSWEMDPKETYKTLSDACLAISSNPKRAAFIQTLYFNINVYVRPDPPGKAQKVREAMQMHGGPKKYRPPISFDPVKLDKLLEMFCRALQTTPNLVSLRVRSIIHSSELSKALIDHAFPFRLHTLSTNLFIIHDLASFIKSQPYIKSITTTMPWDADAQSHSSLDAADLPLLEILHGTLKDAMRFVPGRPVRELTLQQWVSVRDVPTLQTVIQSSSAQLIHLDLQQLLTHPWTILSDLVSDLTSLRSLAAPVPLLHSDATPTTDEHLHALTSTLAMLPNLESVEWSGKIPEWWRSAFLESCTFTHPCEMLKRVRFTVLYPGRVLRPVAAFERTRVEVGSEKWGEWRCVQFKDVRRFPDESEDTED